MGQVISYSNSISDHIVFEKSGNSKYPILKNTVVTIFAIAVTSTSFSANYSNQHLITTENRSETLSISNINANNSETFSIKEKEGDGMSDFKLNEVQKYFDEKISNIKDEVHNIDKQTAALEIKIENIQASIDDLPGIIKTTMREVEQDKKAKFSDKYLAPIIVSVLSPIILYLLAIFGKHLFFGK